MRFRDWYRAWNPIHRSTGRHHDQPVDAGQPRGFEQIERPKQIDLNIRVGVAIGALGKTATREMKNDLSPFQHLLQSKSIGQTHGQKRQVRIGLGF